tara:strand:+ start:12021 stop:14318 length:2298 start_codon:yes stop_codon:yes gene_type:complete
MSQNFANDLGTGLAGPSQIQANLTKSAISKATREALDTQKKKAKYDSNLEVLEYAGLITEETDGTIVLAPDAMDKLGKLSDGNRTQVSNALLMNEMMGTYHAETPDGQLEKKRNQQVFAPVLAKEGAVPFSIEQAAAAGDANAMTLKKQYEDGDLRGYVTPAINQEGLFSLLNVFGSDKKDDKPQVATKEEILTGLQARADKMNVDGDILDPDRSRAIRNLEKQNKLGMSNIGGGSDEGLIELVNGVFDENVNRGTTNSFLKNLQTMYAANPRYTVKSKPASSTDTSIEVGSEQDVMVNTQGVAKTFEQAYPSLQGLDGERLATELEDLKKSGQLDNFGDQQKEQMFTDLREQGIGSIPDLMKKRQEQKISAQEQYKEILMLNTVASRTDAEGKLVLPDGKTPKEATNAMFNAYYTGSPDATLNELATAQNNRRTNIRDDQIADTAELEAKTANISARTVAFKAADANALEWAKFGWTKEKYYLEAKKEANASTISAYNAIGKNFTTRTEQISTGSYPGLEGKTSTDMAQSLVEIMRGGDATKGNFFIGGATSPEYSKNVNLLSNYKTALESTAKDYFNGVQQNEFGQDNIEFAKQAFIAMGPTDKEKENLEKMWNQDKAGIFTYNFAKPEKFVEHKSMTDQMVLLKVFSNLKNKESMWHTIITGPLKGIFGDTDYWEDIASGDMAASALVDELSNVMALRFVDKKPAKIIGYNPNTGEELEESIAWADLLSIQGISGTDVNWLFQNLNKVGDTGEGTDQQAEEE